MKNYCSSFLFELTPLNPDNKNQYTTRAEQPVVSTYRTFARSTGVCFFGFFSTHWTAVVMFFLTASRFMFLRVALILLQVQFDLVTAAFTLSELPGAKDREEAVRTLWRKTNSYLVGLYDVQQYLHWDLGFLQREREREIN